MNEGRYGDRSDVYSFGMILWHLITAEVPCLVLSADYNISLCIYLPIDFLNLQVPYEELDCRTPRHTLLREALMY